MTVRRATELDRALKPNIQWKLSRARVTFIYRFRYRAYERTSSQSAPRVLQSPRTGKQSVESFTTARLRLSSGIKGNDVMRDVAFCVVCVCIYFVCVLCVREKERIFQLELIIEQRGELIRVQL